MGRLPTVVRLQVMGSAAVRLRRRSVGGLQIVGAAVAYYAVAQRSMAQQLDIGDVARFLWPAAGVAVAAVLLWGLKIVPGLGVGSVAASMSYERPMWSGVAMAVVTMFGVLVAYGLLRRVGFRIQLDRVKDALALVFFAAIVAMMITGFLRAGVLRAAGTIPAEAFWPSALLMGLSSAIGVLVVVPVLLVAYRVRWPDRVRVSRALEAAGLVVGTAGAMMLMMSGPNLTVLAFPPLVWAAWRFGLTGTAPCVLLVAAGAVYAGTAGIWPFVGSDPTDPRATLITVQAFNASTALVTLFLAVAVTERNLARSEIENASAQIVDVVHRLDDTLEPPRIQARTTRHAAFDPALTAAPSRWRRRPHGR